jgi:Tfp pilus assembly protein PilF
MKTGRLRASCLFLAIALAFVPNAASAADNWIEVRSPHFTVDSDAGEKEARRIADQFEQIRQMFHAALPTLRVDPAQPIVIIAAKDENTMKLFLPEEWEVKGHIHHAGLYQPGEDKDYVVMRLNSEGENPFHTLYHEYTHALLRLNFTDLPLWLDEGLAEFYGNSELGEKESKTGAIDPGHLALLQQSKLIPVETLLQVDRHSPYYNESNRASIFYAESWALVHFLMLDKEARDNHLLTNFLAAWQKSGSQVHAAQEAFGDLQLFGRRIESYARQTRFMIVVVKTGQEDASKNYTLRTVSTGEALALRGDFFTHHNDPDRAHPVLQQALQAEPSLPFAHEAMGYYDYRQRENGEADTEMIQAIKLGSTGFAPQYFHGFFLVREERLDEKMADEARQSLERAVQLNSQFAPAYAALAQAYAQIPNSQELAVNAAIRAVQLEPTQHHYAINLAYLLINARRFAEARDMAQRILAAATPEEKQLAQNLLVNIQQAEEQSARVRQNTTVGQSAPARQSVPVQNSGDSQSGLPEPPVMRRRLGVDGPISSVDCDSKPELFLNVNLPSGPVTFHAADAAKILVNWTDGSPESMNACSQWKGRRVKVWFTPTPGKQYAGEIVELDFP